MVSVGLVLIFLGTSKVCTGSQLIDQLDVSTFEIEVWKQAYYIFDFGWRKNMCDQIVDINIKNFNLLFWIYATPCIWGGGGGVESIDPTDLLISYRT